MVVLGFILVFVAIALMVVGSLRRGKGKIHGGGAILIGPIPIVFGTSKEVVKIMLIIALTIMIIILMFTFFMVR